MTTITIPKNLMGEKDLMIIPRLQYEHLWKSAVKDKFFKSYSKSDAIYEEQDTDEAIAIYKKEKKQGKLKILKSKSLSVASESSLSKDWFKKEEEKAWQNL